jgi:hypothetical protein
MNTTQDYLLTNLSQYLSFGRYPATEGLSTQSLLISIVVLLLSTILLRYVFSGYNIIIIKI